MDPAIVKQTIEAARQKRYKVYHQTISSQQVPFLKDFPARGPMWISRVTVPSNGDNEVVKVLEKVIRLLGDGTETYDVPACVDVKAEWVGYRAGVDRKTPEPKVSEKEKYNLLMKEVQSEAVMLYAHGGAS